MNKKEKEIQKAIGSMPRFCVRYIGEDPGYHGCGGVGEFTEILFAISEEDAIQQVIKRRKIPKQKRKLIYAYKCGE